MNFVTLWFVRFLVTLSQILESRSCVDVKFCLGTSSVQSSASEQWPMPALPSLTYLIPLFYVKILGNGMQAEKKMEWWYGWRGMIWGWYDWTGIIWGMIWGMIWFDRDYMGDDMTGQEWHGGWYGLNPYCPMGWYDRVLENKKLSGTLNLVWSLLGLLTSRRYGSE